MKFYVENIRYDGLLHLQGWLFDADKVITRLELRATTASGTDVRVANWGFVRNDVYEAHRSDASLKSCFRVYGLMVEPQAQIDLCLHYEDGSAVEVPLALFYVSEDEGGRRQPRIQPLSPFVSPHIDLVASGTTRRDLAVEIERLQARPPAQSSQRRPQAEQEPVNVLVSVYKGLHFLDPFFESVFAAPGHPMEVTVVDNGNTDPEVVAFLEKAHQRYKPRMRLIRVEENEGYIRGICAAYEAAPHGRHVVVLNTDLVLPPGWLKRLIQPILDNDDIATVTPFTNAGTVCSFPIVGEDNLRFRDQPVEVIDRAFQGIAWPDGGVTLPSGVGFCMAHNKAVLERIGYYDADTYGFGYGEENDWCLKAHRLGYRNILLPNMYVWHKHGGVYMAEEKRQLIARNLKTIHSRFPEYHGMVMSYFAADPMAGLRTLVAARLVTGELKAPGRAIVVDNAHASAPALNRKVETCEQGGVCVWIGAASGPSVQVSVFVQEIATTFHTSSPAALIKLLKLLNITDVTVYDLPENTLVNAAIKLLAEQKAQARIALHLVLSDYTLLCPGRTLRNYRGDPCGLPAPEVCNACLRMLDNGDGVARDVTSIEEWRSRWAVYVAAADTIARVVTLAPELIETGLQRYFAKQGTTPQTKKTEK
ncbi:glycosyltransferase family 2 protein (plasmid) [Azospirillum melinis]|uniref:glycosyltransferase family 2 protein n=1 Tax=Azospirillum melinis TaxID=328839 RepID=UPI00375638CD